MGQKLSQWLNFLVQGKRGKTHLEFGVGTPHPPVESLRQIPSAGFVAQDSSIGWGFLDSTEQSLEHKCILKFRPLFI